MTDFNLINIENKETGKKFKLIKIIGGYGYSLSVIVVDLQSREFVRMRLEDLESDFRYSRNQFYENGNMDELPGMRSKAVYK